MSGQNCVCVCVVYHHKAPHSICVHTQRHPHLSWMKQGLHHTTRGLSYRKYYCPAFSLSLSRSLSHTRSLYLPQKMQTNRRRRKKCYCEIERIHPTVLKITQSNSVLLRLAQQPLFHHYLPLTCLFPCLPLFASLSSSFHCFFPLFPLHLSHTHIPCHRGKWVIFRGSQRCQYSHTVMLIVWIPPFTFPVTHVTLPSCVSMLRRKG